jgi:hypothetical protein
MHPANRHEGLPGEFAQQGIGNALRIIHEKYAGRALHNSQHTKDVLERIESVRHTRQNSIRVFLTSGASRQLSMTSNTSQTGLGEKTSTSVQCRPMTGCVLTMPSEEVPSPMRTCVSSTKPLWRQR